MMKTKKKPKRCLECLNKEVRSRILERDMAQLRANQEGQLRGLMVDEQFKRDKELYKWGMRVDDLIANLSKLINRLPAQKD